MSKNFFFEPWDLKLNQDIIEWSSRPSATIVTIIDVCVVAIAWTKIVFVY